MARRFQSARRFVATYWQFSLEYVVAMAGLLALLLFRLSALTNDRASAAEVNTIALSRSLRTILENPLNAPYKLLVWIATKIDPHSLGLARLSSVIVAFVVTCCLFYVIKRWFSVRVALLTTLLFVTSSWYLHIARLVSPEIMLLGSIVAIAYYLWATKTRRSLLALILGSLIFVGLLYLPGFIWLVVPSVFLLRRRLLSNLRPVRWVWPIALLLVGVALIPLLWALLKHPTLVRVYFSLPLPENYIDVPRNLLLIPSRLLWHGPISAQFWLPNTPLMDYFTAGIAVLGAYYYSLNRKLDRSRFVLAGLVASCLLVALGGAVGLTLLLPYMYLLFASGLAFAFWQWKKVFPYNPFAKGLLTVLLACAMTVVCFYQLSHYFIAWPEAPSTKRSFIYRI